MVLTPVQQPSTIKSGQLEHDNTAVNHGPGMDPPAQTSLNHVLLPPQ